MIKDYSGYSVVRLLVMFLCKLNGFDSFNKHKSDNSFVFNKPVLVYECYSGLLS